MLGHADVSFTLRNYVHAQPEALAIAAPSFAPRPSSHFRFFDLASGMSILTDQTVLPPTGEVSDLRALGAALSTGGEFSLVDETGHAFRLTDELRNLLTHAALALSDGKADTGTTSHAAIHSRSGQPVGRLTPDTGEAT